MAHLLYLPNIRRKYWKRFKVFGTKTSSTTMPYECKEYQKVHDDYVFPDKPKKLEITCQNSMSKLRQALENFGQFEMEHVPDLPHLSEKDFLTFIKEKWIA